MEAKPALPHSRSVRAVSSDIATSILYYFGARGLEFDIDVPPNARLPELWLESADSDLSLENGKVTMGAEILFLKPAAYTLDRFGRRHPVVADCQLQSVRRLVFQPGKYNPSQRLIIDPVMTYATYFGGGEEDVPVALREMPDGKILIAGNSASMDLPQAVSLNEVLMAPSGVMVHRQCFVARLRTDLHGMDFVSYLGGAGDTTCTAMDLDASGRILLTGSSSSPTITTLGAQYPGSRMPVEAFLARVSADGKTLQYSTFLRITGGYPDIWMRAGPGETAYLATAEPSPSPDVPAGYQQTRGSIQLLRYDIAAKKFDQKTYFGELGPQFSTAIRCMEISQFGAVYLCGATESKTLPLKNPVQSSPPTSPFTAGFVAAFSPDFRSLLFSSYLGGQGSFSDILSVIPNSDGSLSWLEQPMRARSPNCHNSGVFLNGRSKNRLPSWRCQEAPRSQNEDSSKPDMVRNSTV